MSEARRDIRHIVERASANNWAVSQLAMYLPSVPPATLLKLINGSMKVADTDTTYGKVTFYSVT